MLALPIVTKKIFQKNLLSLLPKWASVLDKKMKEQGLAH